MLESLQDTFWHLLIDWPNTMGTAPCATPVAAARFEIAASMRATDGTPRLHDAAAMRALGDAPVRHRGAIDLRHVARRLARTGRRRSARLHGARAARPSRRRCSAGCWPSDPTLAGARSPLMPPPQRGRACCASSCRRMRDDPAFSARADLGRRRRRDRRDWPACATSRWSRRCKERFGNAVVTRIVARLAELARLLQELVGSDAATDGLAAHPGHPARRRRRTRRRRDRARPAAAPRRASSTNASSTTRSSRRPSGISTPAARWRGPRGHRRCRRARSARRGTAGGARARPLRRVPDRGRPCMKSRWRKACCASSWMRRARTPRRTCTRCGSSSGALAHVEPDALAFCFDAVTRGSVAEGARLEISRTAGVGVVHAVRRESSARAAGRRVSALRQLPAAGAGGRRDAGQGNRHRVTARMRHSAR